LAAFIRLTTAHPAGNVLAAAADPTSMSADAEQLGNDAHYNVSFGTGQYDNGAGMWTLNKLWTCCNLRCTKMDMGLLYKNPTQPYPTSPNIGHI